MTFGWSTISVFALPEGSDATVEDFLRLLDLEPIERTIFRGQNRDIGTGRVFGGQVLAQALVAARRTVADPVRHAHSLHGYFILAGDLSVPIVYLVDVLRDGGSFATRRVTAVQHGRAIFNLSASFHLGAVGVDHQRPAPEVPPPETLTPELERIRALADRIPETARAVLTQDRPLDFRPVNLPDPLNPEPLPPLRHTWFRTVGALPDDPLLHQAALAYASDYGLLATVLQPHAVGVRDPRVQVASLDHALWFHRSFRVDDWLLYEVDAPIATGGRGFARGRMYTREGLLVASSAQEGLTRWAPGHGTPSSPATPPAGPTPPGT
jgi:acyl-CoA thioesterase-2